MNIPVFIPHFGCKSQCVFCDQKTITGKKNKMKADDVRALIEEHLKYKNGKNAEIAFFGGTFTGIPQKEQIEYLDVAEEYVKSRDVTGIRLSTRPDYISNEVLSLLKKYSVKTIELGAQSMCDDVLLLSKRGHTAADTEKAAHLIKEAGFSLGLQMMIGLPGASREKDIFTACEIVRLKADCTRIYPVVVIEGTELCNMMIDNRYEPLSVEDAAETAKECIKIFEAAGVEVLRVGLQETDSLGGGIKGGAYHPAVGEIAYSLLFRDLIENAVTIGKPVEIIAEESLMSKVVGQKRNNVKYLEDKFKVPVTIKKGKDGITVCGKKIK